MYHTYCWYNPWLGMFHYVPNTTGDHPSSCADAPAPQLGQQELLCALQSLQHRSFASPRASWCAAVAVVHCVFPVFIATTTTVFLVKYQLQFIYRRIRCPLQLTPSFSHFISCCSTPHLCCWHVSFVEQNKYLIWLISKSFFLDTKVYDLVII